MSESCNCFSMRLAALVLVLATTVAFSVTSVAGARPNAPAVSACTYVNLSWGRKCIAAGQFCKIQGDAEYHRYGYHCHTGRLSRSAAGGNATGSGCEPGYSPCLPRVADLNCADIPASKRPVRVTGSDPYGLDRDRNGWGCTS
jgi:hypothetical protein